jgi:hypothetical protein
MPIPASAKPAFIFFPRVEKVPQTGIIQSQRRKMLQLKESENKTDSMQLFT